MSKLMDTLKGLLGKSRDVLDGDQFLETCMGSAVLLALADGQISMTEKLARDQLLDHVEQLQVLDAKRAVTLFESYVEAMEREPKETRARILRNVALLADKPELASAVIRVCIAMGKADQSYTENERNVVNKLCETLKLDPKVLDAELDWTEG